MSGRAECTYDLFVSFAEADRAWVEGYLLDALTQAGVSVHTEAAFALGAPRMSEFERALQVSRRTLLVLSPAYLTEDWSQFTDLLAQSYDLERGAWSVIPLILRPVELPPRLAMLQGLDATHPGAWSTAITRLCAALNRPAPEPAPAPPCPYPGMAPFGENDARHFYGREQIVQDIVERLRLQPFLSIIGPSGSGKSSLLYAGVIPHLYGSGLYGAAEWRTLVLRPGPHPIQRLVTTLSPHLPNTQADIQAALAGDSSGLSRTLTEMARTAGPGVYHLLIVDQFEETFAQCKDIEERSLFLEHMHQVIEAAPERTHLIVAIRADFYADCQESVLWPYIESSLINLPPLSTADLRRAITEPAQAQGVHIEPALVEHLITDAAEEKGSLPLLQETMVLLWSRFLRRRLLSLSDYQALGNDGLSGLQVALRHRADAALATLTDDQRKEIARRIFVRLIEFGEGRNDTRRQQQKEELGVQADDPVTFDQVLDHLVDHRLLTISSDSTTGAVLVDLAHEKMIESWPRLRNWLESYHAMEDTRRSLVLATTAWKESGRDASYLFTGKRLARARDWAVQWGRELGESEQAFLAASQSLAQRQQRRGWMFAALSVIVVALAITGLGVLGRREAARRTTGSKLVDVEGGPVVIAVQGQSERHGNSLPFRIEQFEVSNQQYQACFKFGPCTLPKLAEDQLADPGRANYPVVGITAKQAHIYCTWIGRRLPTTVEWGRAALDTEERLWPRCDDPLLGDDPNVPDEPIPVDSTTEAAPQRWDSVYHLADNVSEWVVVIPTNCDGAACYNAWDGKADTIAIMGPAYDRCVEITQATSHSPDIANQSIGFRCVAGGQP